MISTTASIDDELAGKLIGNIGGTGPQGRGLATRFADSGLKVLIGSRDRHRAVAAGEELGSGVEVAERADIVLVAMPWDAHGTQLASLARHLRGKLVLDCVNPLGFDGRGPFRLPVDEGRPAEQARDLLPGSADRWLPGHLRGPLRNAGQVEAMTATSCRRLSSRELDRASSELDARPVQVVVA